MAIKGKTFSINTGALDKVLYQINAEKTKADKLVYLKIAKATDIIWRIAHARRPMISKSQMKAEGRSYRVSDPNAEAGVPVGAKNGGTLQASIKKEVIRDGSKITGSIYTNLHYAKYVEYGTSKMRARPFMRPAIDLSRPALKQLFSKQDNA